jgi:hypothetical protein
VEHPRRNRSWGRAWLGLALALAVHVIDEAANDFLAVWNPAVAAIHGRLPWVPLPTFTFPVWIGGLTAGVVLLVLLAPFAFQARPWMRPVSCVLAAVMLGNALGHLAASAAGGWWAPGAYSSPLLLAAAALLMLRARASAARDTARSATV